jgi:hypothetical protein
MNECRSWRPVGKKTTGTLTSIGAPVQDLQEKIILPATGTDALPRLNQSSNIRALLWVPSKIKGLRALQRLRAADPGRSVKSADSGSVQTARRMVDFGARMMTFCP